MNIVLGPDDARVPAWCYLQDSGEGIVSFVGASKWPVPHPLRFGSTRTHQFFNGEMILRPEFVVATDTLKGHGLAGLATHHHDLDRMVENGEFLIRDRRRI